MSATKKRQREGNTARTGAVTQLLRGGAVGAAVSSLILLAAAVLVWMDILKNVPDRWLAAAACAIGAAAAGMTTAGKREGFSPITGFGIGAVMFLMLLAAGAAIGREAPRPNEMWLILAACLCGSAFAQLLPGGRHAAQKKRKNSAAMRGKALYK